MIEHADSSFSSTAPLPSMVGQCREMTSAPTTSRDSKRPLQRWMPRLGQCSLQHCKMGRPSSTLRTLMTPGTSLPGSCHEQGNSVPVTRNGSPACLNRVSLAISSRRLTHTTSWRTSRWDTAKSSCWSAWCHTSVRDTRQHPMPSPGRYWEKPKEWSILASGSVSLRKNS